MTPNDHVIPLFPRLVCCVLGARGVHSQVCAHFRYLSPLCLSLHVNRNANRPEAETDISVKLRLTPPRWCVYDPEASGLVLFGVEEDPQGGQPSATSL